MLFIFQGEKSLLISEIIFDLERTGWDLMSRQAGDVFFSCFGEMLLIQVVSGSRVAQQHKQRRQRDDRMEYLGYLYITTISRKQRFWEGELEASQTWPFTLSLLRSEND